MENKRLKLPIGIQTFEKLLNEGLPDFASGWYLWPLVGLSEYRGI